MAKQAKAALYGAGALAAAYVAWRLYKLGGAGLDKVNPTNPDNVANTTFERFYRDVTGSEGTPGTDLADMHHREEHDNPYKNALREKTGGVNTWERLQNWWGNRE